MYLIRSWSFRQQQKKAAALLGQLLIEKKNLGNYYFNG
jgi:hypothetical protein